MTTRREAYEMRRTLELFGEELDEEIKKGGWTWEKLVEKTMKRLGIERKDATIYIMDVVTGHILGDRA